MSEAHEPHAPTLPEVTDEAGDTPTWVPVLGLVLLALVALMAVLHPKEEPAPAGDEATAQPAAAPAPAPAGE